MRMFLLTTHIAAGSLGLLAGPMAMLMPKRPGWHPRLGLAYQLLIALLCLSAGGLVILKPTLWWLGVIAALTWAAALGGWWARRHQPRGWLQLHVSLMCGSYISLVTALLVVNFPGSPIAWVAPTAVGTPLITWTNIRLARRAARRPAPPAAAAPQLYWTGSRFMPLSQPERSRRGSPASRMPGM
jgi:hypothetical protein